jgi:protein TonB
MFEQTLAKRQGNRPRGWVLASAVAVHGIALTTVVLASAWSIDDVQPPLTVEIFTPPMDVTRIVFAEPRQEPPAPPPPPQESPPPAPPVDQEQAPEQPAPQAVQPTTLPETVPTQSTGPELETPSTGGDAPSTAPTTGGGTDPNAPWTGGGGDGDLPIALGAGMTPPETIFRVQPRYSESARKAGRQGIVVLRATIDRTGAVTDVRLVKPLGLGLDEAAINAVRQWRFTPATMQGRPVPVFFQLTVTFTIR